jgi:hypothetical protein
MAGNALEDVVDQRVRASGRKKVAQSVRRLRDQEKVVGYGCRKCARPRRGRKLSDVFEETTWPIRFSGGVVDKRGM